MMRRELLVLLGVLLPFTALVVVAWLLTRPEPPDARSPAPARLVATGEAPAPSRAPLAGIPPAAVVDAGAGEGSERGADAGAEEAAVDPAIEAPLRAIGPEVRLCFEDRRAHVRERVRVTVGFRPTPDGGFDGVQVETAGVPDPTFGPCIEDAFEEVRFTLSGRETFQPASHTFVFDPPRR